jgi:dienelactone hydrolase
MPEIQTTVSERVLSAYLCLPRGEGPWPGVVVLHDVRGQTDEAVALINVCFWRTNGHPSFAS